MRIRINITSGYWIWILVILIVALVYIYFMKTFVTEPLKEEKKVEKVVEKPKKSSPSPQKPSKEELEKECRRLNDSIYDSMGKVRFKFLFYTGRTQVIDVDLPKEYRRIKEYNRTVNCIPRVSFYINLYKIDGDKIVKYEDDWNAIIGVSYIMEEGEWRKEK